MNRTDTAYRKAFEGGLAEPLHVIDRGLVAPRGVCLHNDLLAVSDTASNKVLLYSLEGGTPSLRVTLGTEGNARKGCAADTLQYPSGVWTDGSRLIVADAWNHRVLIWHRMPERNGCPADTVVGQAGFEDCEANRKGVSSPPSADTLYWPYGVWSDGGSLWITDTGNRRLLRYAVMPVHDGAPADAVVGQPGFHERDYDPANAVWPYSVKVGPAGQMLVADTQYHRCLYWSHWSRALRMPAERVIGQSDMLSNGANRFRLRPAAETLNWCYDACFTDDGFVVADTGNSRLLHFRGAPCGDPAAFAVTGQADFDAVGEGSLSMKGDDDRTRHLYWPFSVSFHNGLLAVADTGKSRILLYRINQDT